VCECERVSERLAILILSLLRLLSTTNMRIGVAIAAVLLVICSLRSVGALQIQGGSGKGYLVSCVGDCDNLTQPPPMPTSSALVLMGGHMSPPNPGPAAYRYVV
jgi:hypothetical protein